MSTLAEPDSMTSVAKPGAVVVRDGQDELEPSLYEYFTSNERLKVSLRAHDLPVLPGSRNFLSCLQCRLIYANAETNRRALSGFEGDKRDESRYRVEFSR